MLYWRTRKVARSSNSLCSTIQPVGLCAYRRIGGGCEIGCLYRYDEYNEGNLPCTTRIGEEMGGFPVHYLLVDAKYGISWKLSEMMRYMVAHLCATQGRGA